MTLDSKNITKEEVQKMAKLARLGLTEEEIATATVDLARVLGYFTLIQQLDTTNVPTSDDVTGLNNVYREDEAKPEILCPTDQLINNAPSTQQNQFKVKAVFNDPT